MGTKRNPGQFDCYDAADPDEPMFVLLARDPDAPSIVEQWAKARQRRIASGDKPETDRPMVLEAKQCAEAMRQWYNANKSPVRVELPRHRLRELVRALTPEQRQQFADIVTENE